MGKFYFPWETVKGTWKSFFFFFFYLFEKIKSFAVVIQSLSHSPALCNPTYFSMPGSSVLYYLLEFAQIHIHWVGDAIQVSHPLPPPPPFAVYLSQRQGLFKWVNSSHHGHPIFPYGQSIRASVSVLLMNIQGWFPFELTGLISLKSKGPISLLIHKLSQQQWEMWLPISAIQLLNCSISVYM